ncbi:hypothetical protein B0A55_04228 [Friedmanniomyces simplex]|uniref:Uncharacterized protein n=1 Tax=Friedmanniomyces simplex TaxID=329884 RepID=A0A4U0XPT6_9PEZI|nr:hypothetical protein B0A55_04228 [Friedmanniomyces simplex]
MADAVYALTNSLNATRKISGAIKTFTEQRNRVRRPLDYATNITALDHDVRAQIDEVFLVLALLGEALLPLRVFDNTFYPQTLADVEASILSGGHDLMPMAFGELSAELQYAVTSGLAFCSCFAPMPVYRGFGASVLNDWDWGCPDMETVTRKMKARTSVWIRMVAEKQDPQPNRAILESFDQVVQMLQVKQVAFFSVRPSVSGFAAEQPRFVPRREREVKREISVQEDWSSKVGKLGHPSPPCTKFSTWAMPYSTWTSPFSCQFLKTKEAWETIMTNQMDPGRLLHAFVCRQNLDVGESQLLILPPGSPAELLACWLEDLPGMTHKILRWSDFDTELFAKKCGKSLRNQLGRYPLPDRFVVRHPNAQAVHRPSVPSLPTSPTGVDGAVSPPPYLPDRQLAIAEKGEDTGLDVPAAVELDTMRTPVELDSTTVTTPKPSTPTTAALKPARQIHHAASTSALAAGRNLSSSVVEGVTSLRSLTGVRRKSAATSSLRHPPVLVPGIPEIPPKVPERPVSATEQGSGEGEAPPQLPKRPSPLSEFKTEPMMVNGAIPTSDELSAEMQNPVELPAAAGETITKNAETTIAPAPVAQPSKQLRERVVSRKEVPRKELQAEISRIDESQKAGLGESSTQPGIQEDTDRLLNAPAQVVDSTTAKCTIEGSVSTVPEASDGHNKASTPELKVPTQESSVAKGPSKYSYLDLLHKVASGELTPQALQQMLQTAEPHPPPEAKSEIS